ncbi:GNAT family N-acetyltransferase [Desulfosporosinus sp. OT]|uniref:GNAT family N-acetyltransferase n=1 Tax=Desulfosporosinus sp. OT TaxID=913865 RepID=UPI000223A29F|nr:GNAT family N-acetyltransferase [Desulfosporosinus sp. OT]EGW39911.1 acetyltransferase family protein [Desulfosporosinus sp. OT]
MLNPKYQDKPEIKVDPLSLSDTPDVARLYEEVFADHFLGHMGQKFLRLFCSQFVNSSTSYGYIAKCDGKPVGFLLASIDSAPFNKFYRQNFMVLALIVIKKYLTDSYVRKNITQRLGNILVALTTLLPSSGKESKAKQSKTLSEARLLGIGVDSNYRGLGIADKLTGQFCAEMKNKGLKRVGLSAVPWNERAISFYKKDGWIEEERSETSVSFIRDL